MIGARLLAFQPDTRTTDISDNNWLDQYRIPVGSWFEQTVDWIDDHLGWLLTAIKAPFEWLFSLIMSPNPARDSMMSISWLWLVLGFFVLGSLLRNTRVGFMAGSMVFLCGILGREEYDNGVLDGGFWFQTSKTFGMIFVAVLLCAIVGLPLGVMAGRSDAMWNITRPVLDAMQVIHPFVWMLPFVAFWGIGEVSATMVTMLFALPPLVRLTNLGVRQVPEDVVEASRSFGSTELRVLTDVQLPLARPAILTGLNQTLLLSMSMLGIAAIMGADGLGKLIFRAINNKDTALAVSSGVAFFFVAVVLDRITQPEEDDGLSLFGRVSQAWSARSNPEALMEGVELGTAVEAQPEEEPAERFVPVGGGERTALLGVIAGSVIAIIGTLLPWVSDGSVLSSWGNFSDFGISGNFSGLASQGGSWFGIILIALSAGAILAAARPLVNPSGALVDRLGQAQYVLLGVVIAFLPVTFVLNIFDSHSETLEMIALAALALIALLVGVETWMRGTPRLGADGAVIASIGALSLPFAFLFARGPEGSGTPTLGIGVWVALIGALVAVVAGIRALVAAPYASRRPIRTGFSPAGLVGIFFAVFMVIVAASAAWFADEREGFRNRSFARGLTEDGPGLGWPMLIIGAIAVLLALALVDIIVLSDSNRFRMGAVTAGFGLAIMAVPLAWSMVIAVTGDADYYNDRRSLSGAAVLFGLIGGFVIFALGRSAIKEFRRRKIFADLKSSTTPAPGPKTTTTDAGELVGATGGTA